MAKAPAFQFYPSDFLSDAKVAMMTHEECGVYVRLLCHAWLEGSIPADETKLARLLSLKPATVKRLWPALEGCWQSNQNGGLVNPRLEQERTKQEAWREKSSRGGSNQTASKR